MDEPGKNAETVIEVRNLEVAYNDLVVLDRISLEVRRGETLVILGGSGSGKSTLLRHMIGLEQPRSGRILIKGNDITRMSEAKMYSILRKVGVVFQSSALFNSMSVGDNVALPLREHTKLEESTIQIMTRIKLEMVGLSGFEHYLPAELSGGMKKRAGFARAIAMDPEILFCDEPSAGLDPIIGAGLDQLLLKLKRALKMTIVVVTHEMPSVYTIADRLIMLHRGKIIFSGTLEDFRSCENERVRQFIERRPEAFDEEDAGRYVRALTEDNY